MARFKEGVRLHVERDQLSPGRPIAICLLPTAANRADVAGSTIGLRPNEASILIVDLARTLAQVDHAVAVLALTQAADHIAPKPKKIPGKQ